MKKYVIEKDNIILEIDKSIYNKSEIIKKTKIVQSKNKFKKAKYYCFLDIDSTITDEHSDLPDPRCEVIFKEMKRFGHKIYLISGRPKDEVATVIKQCKTQQHAIAENGGLIIKNKKIIDVLGSKDVCTAAYKKIRQKLPKSYKQKIKQVRINNTTEIILNLVSQKIIDKIQSIIDNENLCVEIQTSKRFLHLHQIGINKGYALTSFFYKHGIKYSNTMAIGDSAIDRSMLKKVKYGYVVHNAPKWLQNSVSPAFVTKRDNFEGVVEAFLNIEPRLKKIIESENIFC